MVNHPWGVGVLWIVVNPRESYLQHVWNATMVTESFPKIEVLYSYFQLFLVDIGYLQT